MVLAAVMARLRSHLMRARGPATTLEKQNIRNLTIDTALQGLMMGGIFSFLSVFIVRLGASKLETSLLTSLPALIMALASVPAGQVAQRQDDLVRYTNLVRVFHRGAILVVALLPFVVGSRPLITIIIALWSVKAIANALLESSWMVVVAEIIPPELRARVNGTRWTILSVVTAASVALFGYLLDRLPFPLSYQVVFALSFVGGALGMIYWGRLRLASDRPIQVATARPGLKEQARAYWRSLKVPAFVRYELATSVLRMGMNLPMALYSIYWIRELAASDLWIGWQSTTNHLATIAGYLFWGRIISRKGYFRPLLICAAGMSLYPVLTGLAPSEVWLPLISIANGFFITGVNIAFLDTLLAVCPEDRRPSLIATNTMLASLTIFAAPLLGSFLADRMSIRAVFFIAGGVNLAAALLFWALRIAAANPTQVTDQPAAASATR